MMAGGSAAAKAKTPYFAQGPGRKGKKKCCGEGSNRQPVVSEPLALPAGVELDAIAVELFAVELQTTQRQNAVEADSSA